MWRGIGKILPFQNSNISVQIDFSKELVGWVKSEGYSLLDANLYPKPAVAPNLVSFLSLVYLFYFNNLQRHKTMEEVGRDVLIYLWDNYVQ